LGWGDNATGSGQKKSPSCKKKKGEKVGPTGRCGLPRQPKILFEKTKSTPKGFGYWIKDAKMGGRRRKDSPRKVRVWRV